MLAPRLARFSQCNFLQPPSKTAAVPLSLNTTPSILPYHTRTTSATMGFTDLVSEAGLTLLNNYVKTRSYIVG